MSLRYLLSQMAVVVTLMSAMGQNYVTTLTRDFVPPTPQSAKIQEVQMPQPSLLTGTAEFAIPIYTIQVGDYSLPITLQYHSSGIKVEEDPAPVGYGWTLQPALRATRTVLGRPDELHPFREDLGNDVMRLYECMLIPTAPLPDGMEHADSQHDIFTFSLPGKTITRILDCRSGTPVFVSGIDDEFVVESNKNLSPIDVYGPDGTRYRFDGPTEYQPVDYAAPGTIRTAWGLNEITTPTGEKITINWRYRNHTNIPLIIEGTTFYDSRNPIHWYGSTLIPENLTYDSYEDAIFQTYDGCPYSIEPESITYPGGKVKFNYTTNDRTTYLTSVTVADAAETTIHDASLSYADSKLQSVTLSNRGVYKMDYIGESCSNRFVHAQDWWGYYNDKNNETLTPFVILKHHWEESNAGMYRQYGQADAPWIQSQ